MKNISFFNGTIECEGQRYEIESVEIALEQDIKNALGIYRCVGVEIESNAPADIRESARNEVINYFAGEEYNDSDGSGAYIAEAEKDFSAFLTVDRNVVTIVNY